MAIDTSHFYPFLSISGIPGSPWIPLGPPISGIPGIAEDGVPQAELLGPQLGVLRQRGGAWSLRKSAEKDMLRATF